MGYKIVIRPDDLSVDDWILLEGSESARGLGEIVALLSRFVVQDDGRQLPPDEGRRVLGRLKLAELVQLLNESTSALREALVPLESGAPPSGQS